MTITSSALFPPLLASAPFPFPTLALFAALSPLLDAVFVPFALFVVELSPSTSISELSSTSIALLACDRLTPATWGCETVVVVVVRDEVGTGGRGVERCLDVAIVGVREGAGTGTDTGAGVIAGVLGKAYLKPHQ